MPTRFYNTFGRWRPVTRITSYVGGVTTHECESGDQSERCEVAAPEVRWDGERVIRLCGPCARRFDAEQKAARS